MLCSQVLPRSSRFLELGITGTPDKPFATISPSSLVCQGQKVKDSLWNVVDAAIEEAVSWASPFWTFDIFDRKVWIKEGVQLLEVAKSPVHWAGTDSERLLPCQPMSTPLRHQQLFDPVLGRQVFSDQVCTVFSYLLLTGCCQTWTLVECRLVDMSQKESPESATANQTRSFSIKSISIRHSFWEGPEPSFSTNRLAILEV